MAGAAAVKQGTETMELLQVEGFAEDMLEWYCGLVGENAVVVARWDGAQFGKATVERWAEAFVDALRWVAATWNRDRDGKIGELDLANPEPPLKFEAPSALLGALLIVLMGNVYEPLFFSNAFSSK
ncbi:MAG: hypothetical protein Q9208_006956 [Pyrenodesmia sp. 3 TL-2023]